MKRLFINLNPYFSQKYILTQLSSLLLIYISIKYVNFEYPIGGDMKSKLYAGISIDIAWDILENIIYILCVSKCSLIDSLRGISNHSFC